VRVHGVGSHHFHATQGTYVYRAQFPEALITISYNYSCVMLPY
jgi:hypothetical protein